MMVSEVQIGVRMSVELKRLLEEAAEKSGWSVSQQVRFQLEHAFGIDKKPYLPQVPSSDQPSRRRQKDRAA